MVMILTNDINNTVKKMFVENNLPLVLTVECPALQPKTQTNSIKN